MITVILTALHKMGKIDWAGKYGYFGIEVGMKKELLGYLVGLCQAASAALMASAVIMPDVRGEALAGCVTVAIMGAGIVVLKEQGDKK